METKTKIQIVVAGLLLLITVVVVASFVMPDYVPADHRVVAVVRSNSLIGDVYKLDQNIYGQIAGQNTHQYSSETFSGIPNYGTCRVVEDENLLLVDLEACVTADISPANLADLK